MINLKVELGDNSYPIFIGEKIFDKLSETLSLYDFSKKIVLVTDSDIYKIYGDLIERGFAGFVELLDIIVVPSGEKSKSFAGVDQIISRMLELQCDRNVAVIAFGGGVVGDLAGFAAAIYKRGVNYIQVPTTLLAQVDSSVGGKTGINHALGKNLIGSFHQPKLVWSDLDFLNSLPEKEIRSGLGEIIKYGVIWDEKLFSFLEENINSVFELDMDSIAYLVKRSCEIKAEVVAQDEREFGLRMILNFGHTIGHGIEAEMGYKILSHGEAVLVGMLAESKIALEMELLSQIEFERIANLISIFNLKKKLKINPDSVLEFMQSDKKALEGKLRFALPTQIGKVEVFDNVSNDQVRRSINYVIKH